MKKKEIKKKKHIIRAIKKASERLPERRYYALEKYDKPRWKEDEQRFVIGEIVEHKVNHARRVKKAFQQYGMAGVQGYFTVFSKIKENEENINESPVSEQTM